MLCWEFIQVMENLESYEIEEFHSDFVTSASCVPDA